MTTYIVQASPLTKIFLPEWRDRCLENPELIADTKPFEINIPRPCGDIQLTHMVPVIATTLIPRSMLDAQSGKSTRLKIEENVADPLIAWLTEENNSETDPWGVVAIPIETNVADAVMTLIHEKDGAKAGKKLISEIHAKLQSDIIGARERADARVRRHCQKTYNTILETANELRKSGKGQYAPSVTEALALEILRDQIAVRRKADSRTQQIFERAMTEVAPTQNI